LRLEITERELSVTWLHITEKLSDLNPTTNEQYDLLLRFERVQRHRLDGEIWASEARLNALMDISPEAVFVVNGRSGRILKVNNKAQTMLGYSPRELVGRSVEMLVPSDKREVHVAYRNGFLNSVRKREMGYHPLIEALKKDGTLIQLEIALTATQATDDVMVVCRPALEDLSGTLSGEAAAQLP
jgi:PAS domain S-box-containing protein